MWKLEIFSPEAFLSPALSAFRASVETSGPSPFVCCPVFPPLETSDVFDSPTSKVVRTGVCLFLLNFSDSTNVNSMFLCVLGVGVYFP